MKIHVNNSVESLNFRYPLAVAKAVGGGHGRLSVSYSPETRTITLKPDPQGYKISHSGRGDGVHFTGINNKHFPGYPAHGPMELELIQRGKVFIIKLPRKLPEPRVIRRPNRGKMKQNAEAGPVVGNNIVTKPAANMCVTYGGQTLAFAIPEAELLALTLKYAHAGYAV